MGRRCLWGTALAVACFGLGLLDGCADIGVSQAGRQAGLDTIESAASGGSTRSEASAYQHVRAETGVSLQQRGGTLLVPVTINNTVEMPSIVDSGASDVSIPADVVTILMQAGTISDDDFLGKRTYRLADGSTLPSPTFRIRSVQVGDKVLKDVTGSIALGSGGVLLGQSFLSRFRSWSIDNERKVLVLD
jgi:predicted aspartyl protease